jgi:methylthioribose-1-phosphate isomerase
MLRPATVNWIGDTNGRLDLLDQRLLPTKIEFISPKTVEQVKEAIRTLAVRGAPAIGVAAAYGMVIAAQELNPEDPPDRNLQALRDRGALLKSARPTAVNLAWAVDRVIAAVEAARPQSVQQIAQMALTEARAIHAEDAAMCLAIGRHGAALVQPNSGVLTHCNAGYLATAGDGTALAVLYEAHRRGIPFTVYADETRPLLQGARLTAWELMQENIPVTLITDSMAALVMAQHKVNMVLVGADRIAANGDTANKIGTYSVATLAAAHGIPFYVAAPSSTFDLSLADGSAIPIEERSPEEITHGFGLATAPAAVRVFNPAFDVTPAKLIRGIVTERGIIQPVNAATVAQLISPQNRI